MLSRMTIFIFYSRSPQIVNEHLKQEKATFFLTISEHLLRAIFVYYRK